MRRLAIFLLALLTATSAHAGMAAKRMLACMGTSCKPFYGYASTLNGAATTDMNEAGATPGGSFDSGIGTPSPSPICSGTASITVSCYGGTGSSYAQIFLKVNGSTVQTLTCGVGETKTDQTLNWPVSGRYTAEVSALKVGSDSNFSAAYFSFPVTQ